MENKATKNEEDISQAKIIERHNNKKEILLKLLNAITLKIKNENITSLTDFCNIDRDEIIKEEITDIFHKMTGEIFQHFLKSACGWNRKSLTKNFLLTFLRYACKDLGYKFGWSKKDKSRIIDGKKYRRVHYLYSVTL